MAAELEVCPGVQPLARAAAEHFVTLARQSIDSRGVFVAALAGGSTPREAYGLLGSDELAARVDWPRVHLFWGDERCVPPDHPDSNYRMAREALLDRVPILAGNVHRVRGELPPEEAAAAYERELLSFASAQGGPAGGVLRFDLVLLGMGEDGHTASIFPGGSALAERRRWVLAQFVEKLGAWRVTLTPVVINAAAQVTLLVAGSTKSATLRQALDDPAEYADLPVRAIRPKSGRLLWMVDAAAASGLGEGRVTRP